MGEKVNTFDGSLVVEHTDARLPGNSALDVAIVRRHVAGRTFWIRGDFGDWDLELPRISGVFARPRGWVDGSGGLSRCSQFGKPPIETRTVVDVPPGGFIPIPSPGPPPPPPPGGPPPSHTPRSGNPIDPSAAGRTSRSGAAPQSDFAYYHTTYAPDDYWQGTSLHVPGGTSQELLQRLPSNSWAPTDGVSYPLVTQSQWQIACLGAAANDPGEAFVAVSPAGVRYRFDWMSMRAQPALRKGFAALPRGEYALLATEATDRFGNWVRYAYQGSQPARLTSTTASDGRQITLDRDMQGRIQRVFDGTRDWTYQYDAQGDLKQVMRPDGSQWGFALRSLVHTNLFELGEHASCDNSGFYPDQDFTGVIQHPAGATGTFTLRFVRHGRANVTRWCEFVGMQPVSAHYAKSKVNLTVQTKVLTGPGVPPMTWQWAYAASTGSWGPCTSCGDMRRVSVTAPDNTVTRYSYGIRFRESEGQLLRLEEGWNGSSALRTTDYRYRLPAGMPYPEPVGESRSRNSDYLASRHRPPDRRVVTQQDVAFTWQAADGPSAFDHFARPLRVQHSSTLGHSKSSFTAYFDHSARWVLGQMASVTNQLGQVPERTTYSATTALPVEKYQFGRLTQRLEYHDDGTLFKTIDPVGRATRLEQYKLGVPRRVTHRDGTVESADVDGLGKITRITNAAGTTTTYQYDLMGRLRQVNYPNEPDVVYHPTVIEFGRSAAYDRGLDPGHWVQRITTGNARISRWYDALWRVRLEQRVDISAPTRPTGWSSFDMTTTASPCLRATRRQSMPTSTRCMQARVGSSMPWAAKPKSGRPANWVIWSQPHNT